MCEGDAGPIWYFWIFAMKTWFAQVDVASRLMVYGWQLPATHIPSATANCQP
jgi:hypothetical protein